jgi:hypothetical protein
MTAKLTECRPTERVLTEAVLVVDLGRTTTRAAILEAGRLDPVPDGATRSWPTVAAWDGERLLVGSAARAARLGSAAERGGFTGELGSGCPLILGGRAVGAVELTAALLGTIRTAAESGGSPVHRAVLVVTAPGPDLADPAVADLLEAAAQAGLEAEVLPQWRAALLAPGVRPEPGESVLVVVDLGGTAGSVTLLRADGHDVQVLAHVTRPDGGGEDTDLTEALGRNVASVRDLLDEADLAAGDVDAFVLTGGAARMPEAGATLTATFGRPVRRDREPELTAVRGAAAHVATGAALLTRAETGERPLRWAPPGGSATVLRWLVAPGERYRAEAALARVRLPDGSICSLRAERAGLLARVHTPAGTAFTGQDWPVTVREAVDDTFWPCEELWRSDPEPEWVGFTVAHCLVQVVGGVVVTRDERTGQLLHRGPRGTVLAHSPDHRLFLIRCRDDGTGPGQVVHDAVSGTWRPAETAATEAWAASAAGAGDSGVRVSGSVIAVHERAAGSLRAVLPAPGVVEAARLTGAGAVLAAVRTGGSLAVLRWEPIDPRRVR